MLDSNNLQKKYDYSGGFITKKATRLKKESSKIQNSNSLAESKLKGKKSNNSNKEELKEIWDDLAERLLAGESIEDLQIEIEKEEIDFTELFSDNLEGIDLHKRDELVEAELDELIEENTKQSSSVSNINSIKKEKRKASFCYILGIALITAGIFYFSSLFQTHTIPLIIPKIPIAIFTAGALVCILGLRFSRS